MTRAANIMRPNFGRNTPGRGGSSRITKLIFGTLLFVLVGQLLVTGLTILDSSYKLGLQQPVAKGMPWLTWFFLIYFVMLIGLWFLLNFLGFFPKPEPMPSSGARGSSSSNNGSKGPAQIPGIGGPRARVRNTTPTTTPVAPAQTGFFSSLLSPLTGRRNTTSAAPTGASKASDHDAAVGRAYDEAYERVKAAQRLKRRREMR